MKKHSSRLYHSPARQQQAEETRRRIADTARRLLLARGYEATTIENIAHEAGVAAPTVYATFGSKRGILAEILRRAAFGPAYQDLVREAMTAAEAAQRLAFAARIARQIHDSERAELDLWRGAGVVAPELAAIEHKRERERYSAQEVMIAYLAKAGHLRHALSPKAARDILWALTGRDFYWMLVIERGWTSDRYEAWLADLLNAALLAQQTPRARRNRSR
jgi:AcrR family transcriptional regulator